MAMFFAQQHHAFVNVVYIVQWFFITIIMNNITLWTHCIHCMYLYCLQYMMMTIIRT